MDKYRPCPSIIAMFTSDSQHPPRSKHAVYLGEQAFTKMAIPFKQTLACDEHCELLIASSNEK